MKIHALFALAFCFFLPAAQAEPFTFFPEVPGRYLAKLEIGGQVFDDILEIREVDAGKKGLGMLEGKIFGTYEVPGAFTAEVEQGRIYVRRFLIDIEMRFRITATERGESYPVFFRLRSPYKKTCRMTGHAYLDEKLERPLGPVSAVKIGSECEREGGSQENSRGGNR